MSSSTPVVHYRFEGDTHWTPAPDGVVSMVGHGRVHLHIVGGPVCKGTVDVVPPPLVLPPPVVHTQSVKLLDGWKEATIAWAVCASLHRTYAKGKDALFKTRQADFVKHEEDSRSTYRLLTSVPDEQVDDVAKVGLTWRLIDTYPPEDGAALIFKAKDHLFEIQYLHAAIGEGPGIGLGYYTLEEHEHWVGHEYILFSELLNLSTKEGS